MSIHLSRDLENVQRRVLSLAAAVEQIVEKSIRALFDRDAALARALMESDTPIDMEENVIEEECLKMLALAQGPEVTVPAMFRQMTDLTNTMVRDSLDAFVKLDIALAKRVCRLDDE